MVVLICEYSPFGLLSYVPPSVSQESSINQRLCFLAKCDNFSMFGMLPIREGIIRAFVLGVMARSTCSVLIIKVVGSTSTKIGTSPFWIIGATVVAKVRIGVMT